MSYVRDALETYRRSDGKLVKIFHDDDAESPREWDNAGTMYCWHRRYNLGDKHDYSTPEDLFLSLCEDAGIETHNEDGEETYEGLDRLREQLEAKGYVIVDLYLYDHGGITMSTGKFSCPWDSGQVGVYVLTPEQVQHEWSGDYERARSYIEGDVKTYDMFLTGEVYGYIVYETCGECSAEHASDEIGDSCWGFYGHDHEKSGLFEAAGLDEDAEEL